MDSQTLCQIVKQHIPDSDVLVRLFAGDDHFEMRVISPAFAGRSKVEQHQMVYQALAGHMHEHIHALALKTYTPPQWLKARIEEKEE